MNFSRSFPRVPLAEPFWTWETYQSLLRCLTLGRVVAGPDLTRLTAEITKRLGVDAAILCGSGSLALELALRQCGIQSNDEVIIPSFCCSTVVPPILAVGATPVLADVGNDLNLTTHTVNAALTQKTKAVIVPHLFGNPAEIVEIAKLAQAKNIRVIDDAAQALGATVDGNPTGSFGDFGILSFGAEKVCSGLGGGALVARASNALQECAKQLSTPRWSALVSCLASVLVWQRWRRWTLPVEPLLRRKPSPEDLPTPYRHERMGNLAAAAALSLVQKLDDNIAARRERVDLYQLLLGKSANVSLIPHGPGSACLTQVARIVPAQLNDDAATRVIAELRAAGYEVQGSYMPIHLLGTFSQCVWDWLPNTERLWSDLVELPCGPEVDLVDIERIAEICRQVAGDAQSAQSRAKVATTGP